MIAKKQILEKNIQLLGFRLASRICSIYASADQRLYVPSITLVRKDTSVIFHLYISGIVYSVVRQLAYVVTTNSDYDDSEQLCRIKFMRGSIVYLLSHS